MLKAVLAGGIMVTGGWLLFWHGAMTIPGNQVLVSSCSGIIIGAGILVPLVTALNIRYLTPRQPRNGDAAGAVGQAVNDAEGGAK